MPNLSNRAWAAVAVVALLFLLFVWPSIWIYSHHRELPVTYRTNRITGKMDISSRSGWQ